MLFLEIRMPFSHTLYYNLFLPFSSQWRVSLCNSRIPSGEWWDSLWLNPWGTLSVLVGEENHTATCIQFLLFVPSCFLGLKSTELSLFHFVVMCEKCHHYGNHSWELFLSWISSCMLTNLKIISMLSSLYVKNNKQWSLPRNYLLIFKQAWWTQNLEKMWIVLGLCLTYSKSWIGENTLKGSDQSCEWDVYFSDNITGVWKARDASVEIP